jgi:MoaA/NifB/PqqE/SkfB family radical SAM enzyme
MSVRRDAGFAWTLARKRPFSILVQVTNRCNLTCSFCDFWPNGAPPSQELTVGDYQRVSAELAGLGTFLVSIEGGEPTIRPDLPGIVAAFAERHLTVLYTNGTMLDAERIQTLFAAGLDQVGVSIDWPDDGRHDAKRGKKRTAEKAWAAVAALKAAAPHGGRQVHVMTVLMRDNEDDLPALLARSRDAGVGHMVTLLSTSGDRRNGEVDLPPRPGVGARLLALRDQHPHLRMFGEYLEGIDPFLRGEPGPACRAGDQGANLDHVGNLSPCIEKLGSPVGNVRQASVPALWERLRAHPGPKGCNDCWTLCRGIGQALGGGASARAAWELSTRLRSW